MTPKIMVGATFGLLLGSVALAQTETASGAMMYGTKWSDAVRSTFYADSDIKTLRSEAEIAQGWAALMQEDRDMVTQECGRFAQDTNANGPTGTEVGGDSANMDGTGSSTAAAPADSTATDGMKADTTPEGGTATDGRVAPEAATPDATVTDGTAGSDDPAANTDTSATDTTNTTDTVDAQTDDAAAPAGVQNVDMIALCPMIEGL